MLNEPSAGKQNTENAEVYVGITTRVYTKARKQRTAGAARLPAPPPLRRPGVSQHFPGRAAAQSWHRSRPARLSPPRRARGKRAGQANRQRCFQPQPRCQTDAQRGRDPYSRPKSSPSRPGAARSRRLGPSPSPAPGNQGAAAQWGGGAPTAGP